MPQFAYRAKKGPTEVVQGTIEAATLEEAVDRLGRDGLLPIKLDELKPGGPVQAAPEKKAVQAPSPARGSSHGRVRSSEITIFSRQMSSLLKAGVPILQGLWIITEQSQNAHFKRILNHAQEEVRNGKPFSSVLVQYPKLFPPIYVAMVRAGEDSGTLQETLLRVAEYRQKQEEITSRVRSAMAYPALMGLTGVGTIIYMLTFVIPKLTELFTRMASALPLPTRLLMATSAFLKDPWVWGASTGLLLLIMIVFRTRRRQVHAAWSAVSLGLPFIKVFVMKTELARFARTLELLVKCGIPILRALEMTAPVLGNTLLRAQVLQAQNQVAGGQQLGKSLREGGLFPLFTTNLISVGEESGNLEGSLSELASFYERETDEVIRIVTSLIEPLMILVMGVVVGFIVIAMLLPMFELNMAVK